MEFLNYLNNKMKRQNRNIILLLDNCPSHPDIKLSNIKLVFLPKNTTSELQPLDMGVIAWLKSYYKRLLMTQLRAMKDSKDFVNWSKVTIYAAVVNTKDSWKEMPAQTIVKCFKKCGIHSHIFENNSNQTDETPVIRESDEFDRSCRDHSGLWQKKKHLKKSTLPGKKSTFLAKKAPILQTKSTFGAEKKHLVNIILLTKSNKEVSTHNFCDCSLRCRWTNVLRKITSFHTCCCSFKGMGT